MQIYENILLHAFFGSSQEKTRQFYDAFFLKKKSSICIVGLSHSPHFMMLLCVKHKIVLHF